MAPLPTLSDRMRADKGAIVDAMVKYTQTLRGVTGDTPLTGAQLDAQGTAERYLGEWYVLGQAEAPISDEYWLHKLKSGRTPVQLKEWDRAMQRQWRQGKYIPDAIEALHPDLARVYAGLRQSGQHTGRVRLPGASDETGEISEIANPVNSVRTEGY